MQEIETEELQRIVQSRERFAIKLPVVSKNEFRLTEIIELLGEMEKAFNGAEFYVYCPNLFNQIKIDEPDPRHNSRAAAAGAVLHSMHLDTLPYSSVLVSVAGEEGNALRELCESRGAEFEVIQNL